MPKKRIMLKTQKLQIEKETGRKLDRYIRKRKSDRKKRKAESQKN